MERQPDRDHLPAIANDARRSALGILIYSLLILAAFAGCAGLVRLCERL